MVDVQALTDDELRTKLVEYGFPVMPITGTTRNLMVKKLKLLMESKGNKGSERRSLGKFSSDEESDSDVKVLKADKNRRVTMAVTPMQQSKTSVNVEEKKEMVPPAPVQEKKEKRKSSARSAKIIVQVQQSPDTNSDSEPEVVETEIKKSYEIEVPLKKKTPAPVPIKEDAPLESLSARTTTSSSMSTKRYITYASPSHGSDELEKMRSRLSLSARKEYLPEANVDDTEFADGNAPFLSNFTRRLSQMSPRNPPSMGLSEGRDYDDVSTSLYSRTNYSSRLKARDYSKPTYASGNDTEQPIKSSGSNVSFILIAVVALFFIVLAALYYGMHSGNPVAGIMGQTSKYEKQDLL